MVVEIDRAAIEETACVIAPRVRRTPIMSVAPVDLGIRDWPRGATLELKLENLQHAGSFKARGAFAHLMVRDVPRAGVAAASGGNHGAAVAYAAAQLGIPATIFVPEISSPAKIARIEALGAMLVVDGARYADALANCEAFLARSGALSIHAYDDLRTLLGQGTVAAEWQTQSDGLDMVLVAVGGGGLIGGMAAYFASDVKVVAVEPVGASAYFSARQAGAPVPVEVGGIAADSLGAREVGGLMFEIAQQHVADAVRVEDTAIKSAQTDLWQSLRLAVEPGGAAALAALASGVYQPSPGERVGVLICGGNVDLATLT